MRKCTYRIVAESSFLSVDMEVAESKVNSTLRKINHLQKSYVSQLKKENEEPCAIRRFCYGRRRIITVKRRVDIKVVPGYEGLKVSVEKLSIN
jgi:GTP1/Obg family GTP-binding protein